MHSTVGMLACCSIWESIFRKGYHCVIIIDCVYHVNHGWLLLDALKYWYLCKKIKTSFYSKIQLFKDSLLIFIRSNVCHVVSKMSDVLVSLTKHLTLTQLMAFKLISSNYYHIKNTTKFTIYHYIKLNKSIQGQKILHNRLSLKRNILWKS